MKNTLLIASVASIASVSAHAFTAEFTQYAAARGMVSILQNSANIDSVYPAIHGLAGSDKTNDLYFPNTMTNETHRDASYGFKLAYGVRSPLKYGAMRGELEFGYASTGTDSNTFTFSINKDYPNQTAQTKTSVLNAMANAYYDIATGTRVTPYIGAGFGYAHTTIKARINGIAGPSTKYPTGTPYDFSAEFANSNFAWQLGAGISFAATKDLSLDLGYRYADYGRVKGSLYVMPADIAVSNIMPVTGDFHVTAHEMTLGARYAF